MNTTSNSNSSSAGDDQPSSILIVEDDEIFRQRLARAMTDRGLEVRTASDAPEALVEARKGEPPELAVVDLRMPGGSGLDVVRELKALEPAMRILVLTGYGRGELEYQSHAWTVKPDHVAVDLFDAVSWILEREMAR